MHLNYSYIVTLRRKGKIMKFEIKSRILENAYKLIKSIVRDLVLKLTALPSCPPLSVDSSGRWTHLA